MTRIIAILLTGVLLFVGLLAMVWGGGETEAAHTYENPEIVLPSFVSGHKLPWTGGQAARVGCVENNCSVNGGYHNYKAVDFFLSGGQVRASKAGVVVFRKDGSNEGYLLQKTNLVVIKHGDHEYSWYMHLAQDSIPDDVQKGSFVEQGAVIGVEGDTGPSFDLNGNPARVLHLHFHVSPVWSENIYKEGDEVNAFPLSDYNASSFVPVHFDEIGDWSTLNNKPFYTELVSQNGNGSSTPPTPLAESPSPTPVPSPIAPPSTGLAVISASPQGASYSPGQEFHPDVVVQTSGFTLDCAKDFLESRDDNRYGTWPTQGCQDIGNNRYRIYFNTPMKAPGGNGTYRSRWQIWKWPNHLSPSVDLWFDVKSGGGSSNPDNRAPDTPTLRSPGDWAVPKGEEAPELCWNSVSDPDGDSIQYYAEVFESSTGDNSGWISGTCWRPTKLNGKYSGYQWHVKARDNKGKESGWSTTWHFSMIPPNRPTPTIVPPTTVPTLPPGPVADWWNTEYAYRAPIQVTRFGDQPAGRIINIDNMDTDALVAQGKLRGDRNDLRIVRKLSDGSWQEIARNAYTAWNIEFQLPEAASSGSGFEYYVYYGNPNAGSPPTFASPPQGWTLEYYQDVYWESYVTKSDFNRTIDTNEFCWPERDGGFEHNDRAGSCFDDSNIFKGRVFVPYTGDWIFAVYSPSGYKVGIHGEELANLDYNSGTGQREWYRTRSIYLRAGWHQMDLRASWVNSGPWKFGMEGPNFGFQVIPAEYYQREFGNTQWGIGVEAEELSIPPTPTPTDTIEPTATDTPEPTPTDTIEPTPTETLVPFPTMTPTNTPTEGPTPVPTPIPPIIQVESGANNVKVSWEPSTDPNVTRYNVLRTLGENELPTLLATVDGTTYLDPIISTNPDPILPIANGVNLSNQVGGGCYQVEAVYENGQVASTSNLSCIAFGEVGLWIPEIWAKPGETIRVPINIRNANGLRIATSQLWLAYDPNIITPMEVLPGTLVQGSYEAPYDDSTPGLLRIVLYSYDSSPELYGEGTIVYVVFQVSGQMGDESILELLNTPDNIYTGIGSVMFTQENWQESLPLNITKGRLRVGSAYIPGDLDGGGMVQIADGSLALEMAVGKNTPNWNQQQAGDVNGDRKIGAGDAAMIYYRAITGDWPDITAGHSITLSNSITISLDSFSANPGNLITATLHARNLREVAGGEFLITYDPTIIQSVQVPSRVGLAFRVSPGQIRIAVASNQATTGDGILTKIRLQIAPDAPIGTTTLTIASAKLNDLYGRDVVTSALQGQISRTNGTLTIEPVADPTIRLYIPLIRR